MPRRASAGHRGRHVQSRRRQAGRCAGVKTELDCSRSNREWMQVQGGRRRLARAVQSWHHSGMVMQTVPAYVQFPHQSQASPAQSWRHSKDKVLATWIRDVITHDLGRRARSLMSLRPVVLVS